MRNTYRLFKRGNVFYVHDSATNKQISLRTSDRAEAKRLMSAHNEAANAPALTLALGKTYLAAADPASLTRTWSDVMEVIGKRGGQSTQSRCQRALKCRSFDLIRSKVIVETTAADFLAVLKDGHASTLHHLKLLQSAATDLGWLAGRVVLARKCWPKVPPKEKRAITWDEHCRILAAERDPQRRLFYDILWETGAGQTDAAGFSNGNVDWEKRTLVYHRQKTGRQASLTIGTRLESILKQLPAEGPFFPDLIQWGSVRRSAEFYRRCKLLKIKGVSLHSYRYAWAERAFRAGYPERFAQAALGHDTRAVHHAYARRARVDCPALEEYERKIIPLPREENANAAQQQNGLLITALG